MKRILHLSDMHFGRERPELLEPLLAAINSARPDVVAISGDLTQRARRSQFAAARAFIDRINWPCVVVPGNHDIPLDRPFLRMFRPFSRYRTAIGPNLEPGIVTGDLAVLGVNTVTRWSWQRGRIRSRRVRQLCRSFAEAPKRRLNVLVAHHPFRHSPGSTKDEMIGADKAIETLSGCGAHVVLSGHLHSWHTEAFVSRMQETRVLQVQAGTSLSNRLRGEENDFALIEIDGRDLHVERWVAGAGETGFRRHMRSSFRMGESGWIRLTPKPAGTASDARQSVRMLR